jgi:hypothetical protein
MVDWMAGRIVACLFMVTDSYIAWRSGIMWESVRTVRHGLPWNR